MDDPGGERPPGAAAIPRRGDWLRNLGDQLHNFCGKGLGFGSVAAILGDHTLKLLGDQVRIHS
jgi:hypothetical protein